MPRSIICGLMALTLLTGAGSAVATTLYRWVDAQGVVHYSDTPQPGAQKIEVQSAQTYRAPGSSAPAATGRNPAQKPATQAPSAYQCSITAPTPEQSFFNPESVAISVSVSPAPAEGAALLLTVDGSPVPASGGQDFQLPGPARGDHTIAFSVHDADGRTACTAAPVIFTVQRPSLLSPASPARGH